MGVRYFCDRCEKEFISNGLAIETYARDALGIKLAYMGHGLLCEKCSKKFNIVKNYIEHEDDFFTMTDDDILILISNSLTDDNTQRIRENKTLTNADRLRSMNDEELAEFLMSRWFIDDVCKKCEGEYDKCGIDKFCKSKILGWLQKKI